MNRLLSELRRRNVFRVTAAYLVVGWLVMQVISVISNAAAMPSWADSLALILLLAGLPVAVFIAWAFELTPAGLKPTESIDPEASLTRATGSTLDIAILAGLGLVAALLVSSWLWPSNDALIEPVSVVAEVTAPPAPDAPALEPTEAQTATPTIAMTDGPPTLSVAVLPFVAMSSNEDDGYFADGLTEEILNALAALPDLLVTSRTSAFQFKGDDLPSVGEIAAQLGVAHIVEGSVRRGGDQVRITVQLIRVSDDSHLWSQTYDRSMDDVFAIQEDVASNIAQVLDIVLDAEQIARMNSIGVRNVEAYIAYQRGVEISIEAHRPDRNTLESLVPAEALFAEATALAPDFSDAYLHRADYYAHLMRRAEFDETDVGRAALEAAGDQYFDLLDLAKDTTDNIDQRAMIDVDRVYMRDSWVGAGAILDRASETSGCPYSAWIPELSELSGRAAQFVPYAQRLTVCDPLNELNWMRLTIIAYSAGQFDLAHEAAIRGLRLDSNNVDLMWHSADALYQAGRYDDIREYMDFLQVPEIVRGLYDAQIAARSGDREAVAEARTRMWHPEDDGFNRFELAMHAMMGDRDAANAMAAVAETRPDQSFHNLLGVAARCRCGAPWDLEATPNFARRIAEAEFPWPPPGTGDYPLKDW
jgi:adenylate cyclase